MDEVKLHDLKTLDLLSLFANVIEELRQRGVTRSSNNPVADYAEYLVAHALSLTLLRGSSTGCDAVDTRGKRYEIKARRLTKHNSSTQLSAIRGLDQGHFNYLVGVLFDQDFSINRACIAPYDVVRRVATYRKHDNAWILFLRPSLWEEPGVEEITGVLCKTHHSKTD